MSGRLSAAKIDSRFRIEKDSCTLEETGATHTRIKSRRHFEKRKEKESHLLLAMERSLSGD